MTKLGSHGSENLPGSQMVVWAIVKFCLRRYFELCIANSVGGMNLPQETIRASDRSAGHGSLNSSTHVVKFFRMTSRKAASPREMFAW